MTLNRSILSRFGISITFFITVLYASFVEAKPSFFRPNPEDFTMIWWQDGSPYFYKMAEPAPQPILNLVSGSIGCSIHTKSLQFLHIGRFKKTMDRNAAIDAWQNAIDALPPLALAVQIKQSNDIYKLEGRGPDPKDAFFQPVQFIENGAVFQRVAIENISFATSDGIKLKGKGRMEISLWPDRLMLAVEYDAQPGEQGILSVEVNKKRVDTPLNNSTRVYLPIFGGAAKSGILEPDKELRSNWDESLGCWQIRLPEKPWSNDKRTYYPEEHLDRLDRWPIKLRNQTENEITLPLMFVQENHLPITGFVPMLCYPDGSPAGIPVQISKNWHQQPEKGILKHQGPWFHGCAFIRLPAKSTQELLFTMTYARWGGVPAASHSQLSLIGWGHNLFWDQAAIGSFGESICYEPGRVQRRCFIDDFRPLMVLSPPEKKPYGWAPNAGGGDFLLWIDQRGIYRGFKGTRAEYRSYGPCLTEVVYREETSGGEIRSTMTVSLARTDDNVRAFHRIQYEVLKPVRWQRLAFHQLGADYYNDVPSRHIAFGNANGLSAEWTNSKLSSHYESKAVPLTGRSPWISAHDVDNSRLPRGIAAANRGLIVLSWNAVLGGQPCPAPHAYFYGNEEHKGYFRTCIEIGAPPGIFELLPGDKVDGLFEWVIFPSDPSAYYGPNQAYRTALMESTNGWSMIQREAAGNAINLSIKQGRLDRTYPVSIELNRFQKADFQVQGGLGFLPVTFTGLDSPVGYELRLNDKAFNQSIHGNDFWQTDYDVALKKWRMTFNLPRDATGSTRVEFQYRGKGR